MKSVNLSLGWEKSCGGFAGYQSCDLSDILLLEANSDGHHTTKYPLIDIQPTSRVAFHSLRLA